MLPSGGHLNKASGVNQFRLEVTATGEYQIQAGRRRVLEGLSDAEITEHIEQLKAELGRRAGEESQGGLGSR